MSRTNKIKFVINIGLVFILTVNLTAFAKLARAAGVCGSGTWISGNLEIHHINIGQGDSTLIVGPTGRTLLFDAGESNWNSSIKAQIIGPYIESVLGCKSLDYVVISHFHLDHIGYVEYGGLWHLVETQGFTVGTTVLRDYTTYLGDISGTFTNWKSYLEGAGQAKLNPITAIDGSSQVNLGAGVSFNMVTHDGNGAIIAGDFHGDASPPSENDYSLGAVLSFGDFDEWIGGDLDGNYEIGGFGYTYHDIELSVAREVGDVDVYKVNHHASSHSSSATFVNQLDPEVSIVTVGDGNTYGHPTQPVMDLLLGTSTVYMTERGNVNTNIGSAIVAGHIVIKTTNGSNYTVNGTSNTATEPARTDLDGDGYFTEVDPNDNLSGIIPAPNGGCGPIYQTCLTSCQVTAGQVLINEALPAPSSGSEWMELYNTTASTINIGYCYIDDIPGGSAAYQIPAATIIPAHGFWSLDRTSYFNNSGDDVRLLKENATTVLDSFTYGNTGSDLSWYRFPDGGAWADSPTASTTKGQSNNTPFSPIVLSSTRASANPTSAGSVDFTVTFSEAVTGLNTSIPFDDFSLTTTGVTDATITALSGSGAIYTITVDTGIGNGTIRLNIVDDNTILDATSDPLGGAVVGDGDFTSGEIFTVIKSATFTDVPLTHWANGFIERLYNAGITSGCSVIPLNYCPTNIVTRAQMAIFLVRSMHGVGFVPPTATEVFFDVPVGSLGANFIEQLAADGITSGCGGGNFCPNSPVTRAQMAVFLVRSKHGVAFVPPTATGVFADVPVGSFGADFIEQLVADAITSGCGGGNYCPNNSVTRDQMAVFLVRAFNLP
ncbi:MAG: S-layer homology domain-containing protein [Chloroflexi bacterium]|nr:S-layer homology domain-containing protein [Chloroflexota bacterium]